MRLTPKTIALLCILGLSVLANPCTAQAFPAALQSQINRLEAELDLSDEQVAPFRAAIASFYGNVRQAMANSQGQGAIGTVRQLEVALERDLAKLLTREQMAQYRAQVSRARPPGQQ